MCSFMVYTGDDISEKEFKEGFERIKYRGPEMSNIIKEDGIWG